MAKLKENPLITALVGETTTKLDEKEVFFGELDEASSFIMLARAKINDDKIKKDLEKIVYKLQKIMGEIAGSKNLLTMDELDELIALKDETMVNNGIVKEFILPGQNEVSATIHVARTSVRRAELAYAKVYAKYHTSDIIFEYINKLSLYLYFLGVRFDK